MEAEVNSVKSFNSMAAFSEYIAGKNTNLKVLAVKGNLYRIAAIDAMGNKLALVSVFKVKS